MYRRFHYVKLRNRFYPLLPVVLHGPKRKVKLYALLDSGAVISLFHTSIVRVAGIDLEGTEEVYLSGVGEYVRAYRTRVLMEVEGMGPLELPVAFTEYISADLCILGHEGFFEKHEVIFKEYVREMLLNVLGGQNNMKETYRLV